MLTVHWFKQHHEHRNDYFRFGLMQKHIAGELKLQLHSVSESVTHGFPKRSMNSDYRHTSLLLVEDGRRELRVAIDNEDGFVHMSPLIKDVDLYFCCPFNQRFHGSRKFPAPYEWQTNDDVRFYREMSEKLLNEYSEEEFAKIVPLGPSPTDMEPRPVAQKPRLISQQLSNLRHKASKLVRRCVPQLLREEWLPEFQKFQQRYRQIISYRNLTIGQDVVSRESLWRGGWPRHRINLHEHLHTLKEFWNIHTQLVEADGWNDWDPVTKARLGTPIELTGSFEEELCASRLPVFPCGAHWGWRGIVFLTLCAGSHILIDQPLYEPYFEFKEFRCDYNTESWQSVGRLLSKIDGEQWVSSRIANQNVFDRRFSPSAYADYICRMFADRLN